MRIVVLDGGIENPGDLSWEALGRLGDLTVYDRTESEQTVERIGDAEAIFTNKVLITEAVLEQCPQLRFIGVLATGYNVVDTAAARARGIPVCNIPEYGTDAVAQYTMALLLELCHHIGEHSACVKRGDWTNGGDWCFWNYPLVELSGKTIGIIGFGRIGKAVARLAQAFGMKVLAYARHPQTETKGGAEVGDCRFVSLEELLAQSDVISLHCPLTPQTQGMIGREAIAAMKDGVFLINTARGPLIQEDALAEALKSGKVGGAAVDVVSQEPIQADNPLLYAPNMIITPHIAWAPREARQRLMDTAVANLKAFQEGKAQNVVN
ncbi:MAG: D-2-hydroxyacid dehydrogenase [Eubacteriales bacterium]|nr:D-2-hydroxyacid dehydrogenase [Eubacteriales bacterium]